MGAERDPVIRCRKDILGIVVCELRETLRQGNPRPVADVWLDIETLIARVVHEAVRDAIRETDPDE